MNVDVDDLHLVGSLAGSALDFFVPLVTNQEDVVIFLGETLNFAVNLGHQRTRGIDGVESASLGCCNYRWRNTVSRKHEDASLRHLVDLVDEDSAALFKRRNHVFVVNDLLANINRSAVVVESLLDSNDCAVNSRAISTRGCEQNLLLGDLMSHRGVILFSLPAQL